MYENYAKIRDLNGLKDSDVSKGTGITSSVFSDWKKGRYELKYEKLRKIADFLGVNVEAFDDGYYQSEDTRAVAQDVFDDPDLRILFDAARGSRPEDIRMAADMLKRFKETNPDG